MTETLDTNLLTVVRIEKVVSDLIGLLKKIAVSSEPENKLHGKMIQARSSLETQHEGFMDLFIENQGVYQLQECLRSPHLKVVLQVFEIVPHFFNFKSVRGFIKGKLDFFTALYLFMSHRNHGIRAGACQMFNHILQKLSRGTVGYNLITKAAINQAQGSNRAPFDELIESLSMQSLELRVEVLTLINLIVYISPSQKKKAQFLARLENMGLYDEMYKVGRENSKD